jgi:hypothetical protein
MPGRDPHLQDVESRRAGMHLRAAPQRLVFDSDHSAAPSPNPLRIDAVIRVDPPTLLHDVFGVAPEVALWRKKLPNTSMRTSARAS